MIAALRILLADFLSTLVFLGFIAVTGQARVAVVAAVAVGLLQLLRQLLRHRPIDAMQWFGLLLTLVLGGATLAFHDPRFIMVKPSLIHAALGTIMLRRGWLARYLPERAARALPPGMIIGAGFAWAMLMFALSAANLVVALALPMRVWGWFISIGLLAAKLVMLLAQYAMFRHAARRRMTQDATATAIA